MDDAVHVDVEVVGFEVGGVGEGQVEGEGDGSGVGGEVDSGLGYILDDFGVLLGEPAVEGRHSHDDDVRWF